MNHLKQSLNKFYEKFFSRMSKKRKIYLLIFISILSVLLWAFLSAGIITHSFNRNMLRTSGNKQNLEVKSMILTQSQEGKKSWEIFGETGEYSSDHKIAKLNNMIGNFYKDNKVNMSFQSSRGTYNEETHLINMYENTYVVLENDISVIADNAVYDTNTGIVTAKGNVKINRKGSFIATADEAIVNSEMTVFKITGNTTTKIYKRGNND